jgi:hypothetical protein
MAALDFSQFASQPSFGERYAQGQQQALQNELAKQQSQMQTENMLGLREERSALADQRRAATEGAAKRQAFLSGLGAKMSEGGHKLDRPTLSSMLQFGLMNKEGDVAKLATEGLRALDEEDAYKAESERLGTGATDQKFTPVQIQNMLVSPSIRIREQGKALAQMTPKDALLSPDVEAQRIRIEGAKRPDRLLTPEEEAQKVRLAIAGRTPAQPRAEPTPSVHPIVDPTNPKQMISIDTRVYRGGGMGSPGVIGVAGREPGYVAREEKAATKQTETDKSREQVDNLVAQLGSYYDALSDQGGITSTGLRAGSNAMAGLASSGLGQATGRLFGTQAQSQRNSIVQTRPLLVQAIKNATGMSAKQMDSNVELKLMLATATDPTLDLEANRRALANLAALYGTGGGAAPRPKPGAPTRANAAKAMAAPTGIEALLNKYP